MSRKQFIESQGATCNNWNWSWSFVNHPKHFVIFGVWDRFADGMIFAEDWRINGKGQKSKGFHQSLEHIRLIEEEGYRLMTFPMEPENDTWKDGEIPKINSFTPELSERKLVRKGSAWYASKLTSPITSAGELAAPPVATGSVGPFKLLARITYNTKKWQRPSGPEGKGEAAGSYSTENGFGHEEWLFRSEWLIDGWRYGFIEGFNRGGRAYVGQPLEVTLFTRQPDNQTTRQTPSLGSYRLRFGIFKRRTGSGCLGYLSFPRMA